MKNLIVVLCILFLVSCSPVREVRFEPLYNSISGAADGIIEKNVDYNVNVEYVEDRILKLEDSIISINGIKNASVIIIENAAIVSINLEEGIGNPSLPTIRRDIERRVKEIDKNIRYVSVTATPELIEKLHLITDGNDDRGEHGETITNLRPPI